MRRFVVLLAALLAGAVLVGGFTSAASAASKSKPAKPVVKILTPKSSQLSKGKIRIHVKANKGAKVRLSAVSKTFDKPNLTLFTARTLNLRRKKSMAISISLTPAAKAIASGCQANTLVITAKNGKKQSKISKSVNRDLSSCNLSDVNLSRADDCDFIAQPKEGMCMLPFPNDFYTVNDPDSPTGKRVHFTTGAMPQNRYDTPISPENYDLSDGFSQGQGIVVKIPGLDSIQAADANDLVPINHIGDYADPDQRVVVINTDTGERHPIWANVDSNADTNSDRVLEIKPAENFDAEGHYIVALRNLTDATGKPLAAPNAFRYYRDSIKSDQPAVEARRAHFEKIFKDLKKAGIERSDLYLA